MEKSSEFDIEVGNLIPNNVINLGSNFEKLKDKCSQREKAHKACRDRNKTYNNILKGIVILSSSFATYITNFNENEEENLLTTLNKISTFTTTIFAGFDAYFNNSKESEGHHQTSRAYANLKHDISGYLRVTEKEDLSKDTYTNFHTRYTNLHSNSTSLFKDIRKKYIL